MIYLLNTNTKKIKWKIIFFFFIFHKRCRKWWKFLFDFWLYVWIYSCIYMRIIIKKKNSGCWWKKIFFFHSSQWASYGRASNNTMHQVPESCWLAHRKDQKKNKKKKIYISTRIIQSKSHCLNLSAYNKGFRFFNTCSMNTIIFAGDFRSFSKFLYPK